MKEKINEISVILIILTIPVHAIALYVAFLYSKPSILPFIISMTVLTILGGIFYFTLDFPPTLTIDEIG